MKKLKVKIISTFVLLIILVSNFLPISFATYQNLSVNETSNTTNIDIESNTIIDENITNLQENNNTIMTEIDNEVEENVIEKDSLEITNFDVLLSGILIPNDLELTNSNVKEINSSNEQLMTSNGIWIEENSRDYLLNLINSVSNENYIIDEEGFLRYDENNVKKTDDKKEKYNFYTSKIDELMSRENAIIVSIENNYKSLNSYDNEILDMIIEDDEFALIFKNNDEKSNISDIIILNKEKYNNDDDNLNSEMILMNKFLETFFHEDEEFNEFILNFEQYMDNENINNSETENKEIVEENEPLDTPLELDFNENELSSFDVVLSGILYDVNNITIENINTVNDIKPKEYGIWVEENSRYAFLKFLNNHGIYTYSINENGYLMCDNIMKDNINLDFKDVTEVDLEIATILSEDVTLYITIDNKYLSNETGIVTYSYLDQEEYVKTFDNEELDNRIVILNSLYFNDNTEFDLAISDRFVKRIFDYGQGIELYSDTSKYGYMTQSRNVYFGPNDTDYAKVGSVDNNEKVYLLGKSAGWYHIQYHVGSTGTQKSGFVPESTVTNIVANPAVHEEVLTGGYRYANSKITVYSCDDLSIAVSVGSVSANEGITLIYNYGYSGSNGSYNISYIEYSTSGGTKRGYTKSENISNVDYPTSIARVIDTNSCYAGPDSYYFKLGGSYYNEYVSILAKNTNNDLVFVEYNTTSGRKRGFMSYSKLSNCNHPGNYNDLPECYSLRKNTQQQDTYSGPNTSAAKLGLIYKDEVVSICSSERGWAYVEYHSSSGTKRGYVQESLLSNYSSPSIPDFPNYGSFTSGSFAKSGLGKDIKYYKLGNGKNVAFAVFAQHGWEDAWACDGIELVNIAGRVMQNLATDGIASNWTLYIIPCANPDGITDGYTNVGKGRCTVSSSVDMNRCWPANFSAYYDRRNYTGDSPLGSKEALSLMNFIDTHKGTGNKIILDIHGWLNKTYGNPEIGKYFQQQFGFTHSSSYGKGYLQAWGNSIGAKSSLVELPMPSSSQDIINNDYSGKLATAIKNMLSSEGTEGGTEVSERVKIVSTGNVNIRSGAGTSYSIVTSVSNGTTMTRIRKNVATANGYTWDKVRLDDGSEGYIATNFLSIIQIPTDVTGTYNGKTSSYSTNMRISDIPIFNEEEPEITKSEEEAGKRIYAPNLTSAIINDTLLNTIHQAAYDCAAVCTLSPDMKDSGENLLYYLSKGEDGNAYFNEEPFVGGIYKEGHVRREFMGLNLIGNSNQAFDHMEKSIGRAMDAAEKYTEIGDISVNFVEKNENVVRIPGENDDTMNWKTALGEYRTFSECTVNRSGSSYTMYFNYHIEDYYDWREEDEEFTLRYLAERLYTEGILDTAFVVASCPLWQMNITGLARNYTNYDVLKFRVTWIEGQTADNATISLIEF